MYSKTVKERKIVPAFAGGVLILSTLSLFSVGFASWCIGANDNATLSFDVSADNIININDFIQLDKSQGDNNTGIACFDYCKDGFVNNGEVDVNNGFFYVYAKLNLDEIRNIYGEVSDENTYTSFAITTKLSFSSGDGSIFSLIALNYIYPYTDSGDNKCGVQANYRSENEAAIHNLVSNNEINDSVLSSSFNGFQKELFYSNNHFAYITISYNFKIDYTKCSFDTDIYPHLKNSKFYVSFGMGGY